jgi:hypothetical protein
MKGKAMKSKRLFLFDAIICFVFGIGLLIFPKGLTDFLGVPYVINHFYPNLLGATLTGIAFALVIEYFRKRDDRVGLGFTGAAAIDVSLGVTLSLWVIFGKLDLALRGQIFLGALGVLLIGLSIYEFARGRK